MSYEILKLQYTHYSKRGNISPFRFWLFCFFALESFQSGPPWKIMAEDSEHFKGIKGFTCQTFEVGFSIFTLLPTSAVSSLVLAPNVDVHHHSFLYLIISASSWEC